MQSLQQKQQAEQQLRDILSGNTSIQNKGIEERVAHCKHLQYNEHQQLFAVMYSSIHKAASDNSVSGIKYFLSSRQKPKVHVDDYDSQGNCPIHMAAEKGCNDAIKTLVENGCDVDVRSTYGNTAMMHACKENQLSTIKLLFELGSLLHHRNKAGQSAIHYAAQGDHVDALALLVELHSEQSDAKGGDDDDLGDDHHDDAPIPSSSTKAREFNDDEQSLAAESVMTNPSNPSLERILNIRSNNGMTPLHLAALYNSTRAVDFLLDHGAKINAVDNSGDTCLHKAAKKGAHGLFKSLVAAGANDNIKNQFGEQASHVLRDEIFY